MEADYMVRHGHPADRHGNQGVERTPDRMVPVMTTDAERIAKLETHVSHLTVTLERMEEKLDKSLERHDAADKKQQAADSRITSYENQVKGARWAFSILAALGAFFGFKVGIITLGGK